MKQNNLSTPKQDTLNVSFICTQPINLSLEMYSKLTTSKYNISEINSFSNNKFSMQWMSDFTNKNNIFDYLFSIRTGKSFFNENLKNDLNKSQFHVNDMSISKYLNSDNIKYDLVFDLKFLYFLLIYEIEFTFPVDILEKILEKKKNNLYHIVRKLLVKEDEKCQISRWSSNIVDASMKDIMKIMKLFNLTFNKKDFNILNNSGNISVFVTDKTYNKTNKDISNLFVECNEYSERLNIHTKPIYVDDSVSYSFYGRFHTITVVDEKYILRYMPIQFQMQFLWFLINYYNKFIDKINIDLLDKKNEIKLEEQNELISELINKIEMLVMHNDRFITAIEIDNELIYKHIEKKWNILNSLDNSKKYMTFFKGYLERVYSKKIAQAQKKQNRILFGISFLQITALISVWTDYLSLLNEQSIKNIDEILFLFSNSKENLMLFNKYIPLGLLSMTFIALLYLVIWRKR